MRERENVLHVLNHTGKCEWVPMELVCFDFDYCDQLIKERPQRGTTGASGYDWFGCHWTFDPQLNGFTPTPMPPIVSDITKWRDQVRFPDLDSLDWATLCQPTLQKLHRDEKLFLLVWPSGVWERFHALVGFEKAFMAFYDEPEAAAEFLSAIADYRIAVVDKVAKYLKVDIILNLDDYGGQNSPLMSLDMFRKHIKPHAKRVGQAIVKHGIRYAHHSCGKMDIFVEDIIDMGATLIHPFAPSNDAEMIQKKYGDKICIYGGLNSQMISLPGTTEEQLRAEVRRAIDKFAPHKNYIVGGTAGFIPGVERWMLVADETIKYGKNYWGRAR